MIFRTPPEMFSWTVTVCTYVGISGWPLEHTIIGIEAHCEDKAVDIARERLREQGYRGFVDATASRLKGMES